MTRPADRERTMRRMGTILRTGYGASARDSAAGYWLKASKPVRRIGGSRALILTDELKEAGYGEGDDVTVMILRKRYGQGGEAIPITTEDDRMCIYEICPMMTGGEWPDCKKCPYADGTEGDERMRTHYLYDIERILGTFEDIKEHEGKNATGIAKGVGYQAVIGRINEFKDKGLVRTYSLHRDIYLTPKG